MFECLKDRGITALAGKCPELQTLYIIHCDLVTAKGLMTLIKATPKLSQLYVQIEDLADADITTITQYCPKLHTIDLGFTSLVTDVGIQTLVSHYTQLRTIEISRCTSISTGYCLFRNVHNLNIYDCTTLTDTMVATIVQNNPLLESLSLSHCPQLTSTAVLSILYGCSHLRSLTFSNISIFSLLGVRADINRLVKALIKDHYPQIKWVNIDLKWGSVIRAVVV